MKAFVILAIAVGDLVTFKLDPHDAALRCGRITSLQQISGDVPAAWVVEAGTAPQRVVRLPLVEVHQGCAS